jgi:hypothetical protein
MGASATLVAMLALSGYARLTLTAMSRTGVTWLQGTPQGLLRRVGLLIRAMIPSVREFAARWLVSIGIVSWIWFNFARLPQTLAVERRAGLGGNVPLLNWLGPKITLAGLWAEGFRDYEFMPSLSYSYMPLLAAVFMMTAGRRKSRLTHRLGRILRWGTTAVLGAAMCLAISKSERVTSGTWSRPLAWGTILFDVPFTLLLYVYQSRVATAVGSMQLSKRLMKLGLAGALLQAAPLALLVISRRLRPWHGSMTETAVAAAYGAVSMIVTALALAAVVKLAWTIAQPAVMHLFSASATRTRAQAA